MDSCILNCSLYARRMAGKSVGRCRVEIGIRSRPASYKCWSNLMCHYGRFFWSGTWWEKRLLKLSSRRTGHINMLQPSFISSHFFFSRSYINNFLTKQTLKIDNGPHSSIRHRILKYLHLGLFTCCRWPKVVFIYEIEEIPRLS